MINTIFLDMDGVLANFRKGIHKVFMKSYDYPTLSSKWKFWDDWPDVSFAMVNTACTTEFWTDLEWMHDGRDILHTIGYTLGVEKIYLLTTPMPNLESASGKMIWVNDNLPAYLKYTIITQVPKHLLARPNILLIDDRNENVDGFRKAGGKALLVPRPWNRAHLQADRTVEVVKEFLERICQES